MGNKLSSTNIAELLEQHLKAITDVNNVIVRSNISADVVANINDNIEPISEALKSLDTISEILSSSKLNILGDIKYNYGIKTVVNNLNELLTAFNEISIDESKLDDFKKAVKPINEVIEAITSISDKMSNMKIGSIFGNAKFSIAIKGIIENIKIVIEQLKAVDTDEINDEHFKSLSSAISSIVQLTNDLVKIGTIAPLLVALSPSIILAVRIIILINKQFSLVGKKGALGALNAAIIGKALAEFAKGILVFLVASLGGIVFILGVVALLAMKVFMSVFFLLFNKKQMKDILIATIVIMSMAKAIMLISMVVILWALTGQVVMEEWKNILVMMGFVMLAVVVFVLFGLLSQFIKQGNRTLHQLALTLILLSLTVVLWALTGELIAEQHENIFTVVKFVIVALILFTVIGILGKIIRTGARELVLISLVLVVLSLTVLLWAATGEYISSKWKEILIVSGFVSITIVLFALLALAGNILKNGAKTLLLMALTLIVLSLTVLLWSYIGGIMIEKWQEILVVSGFVLLAIGLFALLALAGNILKNGAKTVLLMVLALALISVVILLWAFIGEVAINDYASILAVIGFIAIASLMMFILGKIYKHVLKGMIVAVLISAALFILVVVAALAVQVGKMMLENWGGVLMLVGFIVVIVGIFAILGIPAVFGYVVLGAIVMAIIGAALLLFSVSMLVFVLAIKLFEFDDVLKMMALIGGLGAAVAALGLLMPLIMLGSVAMVAMGAALMVFVVPILIFAGILAILKKIDATEEDVKKPIHLMGAIIDAINEEFGDKGIASIALAAAKILLLVPVALAIGAIATTLQYIADLKMATEFNNEGKPIKFVKMKAEDFALAGQNAIGMIKIMASIFGDQTKTVKILGKNISIVPLTESELNGITGKSKKKIKQLSQITGFIGNIAETLQNVASLKIPTDFNEEGKPIKFRRMWSKDFIDAAKNSATMVKIMAAIFGDTPQAFEMADLKFRITPLSEAELEGIRGKSKRKMRKLSKITSYVGIICNTIGSLAALTFPTQFNEEGQATSYEKITEAQLVNASVNAMGMVKLLSSLFSDKSEKIKLGGTEIMTMPIGEAALENLKNSAKRKMKRLAKITGYIGTITNTLGSISLLNIPVEYDEDGNATKFEKITETQLINASVNATGIVKMLAGLFGDKVSKVTISGKAINVIPLSESEIDGVSGQAKRKMKKLTKITKHISTITTILGSIAALRVPVEYDEEGNPKTFEQITQDQLVNSSANVCGIIKLLTGLFGDSATTVKINGKSITVQNIAGNELDAIGISAAIKMATLTNIAESVSKSIKKIADLGNIETPNSVALNSILNFIKNSVVTIAGIDFSKLIGPSDSQKLVVLDKVLNSISSLDVKKIIESFKSVQDVDVRNLSTAGDKLKAYMSELIKVYGSLNQQSFREVPGLNNFVNFSNSFSKFGDIDASKIETLQTKLTNLFSSLNQISTSNANNLNSFLANLESKITSLKEAIDGLNRSITNFNSNTISAGSGGGSNPTGSATQSNTQRGSESSTSGKTLNDIYNCVDAIEWLLDDIRRNTVTSNNVNY
jgi:hypothetical protein